MPSSLKYIGVGTETLGWILCAVLLAAATTWLIAAKPWLKPSPGIEPLALKLPPTEVREVVLRRWGAGTVSSRG